MDINDNWGVQPEVVFSQTNTTETTPQTSTIGDIIKPNLKAKMNYMNIPILLRYNVNKLLTFNVGPQFSILTKKEQSLTTNGKDAFKSGDLSAVVGLQLNLNKWRVYGRYNVGITKLNDVVDDQKWTSQNFQFGVGYTLF